MSVQSLVLVVAYPRLSLVQYDSLYVVKPVSAFTVHVIYNPNERCIVILLNVS